MAGPLGWVAAGHLGQAGVPLRGGVVEEEEEGDDEEKEAFPDRESNPGRGGESAES